MTEYKPGSMPSHTFPGGEYVVSLEGSAEKERVFQMAFSLDWLVKACNTNAELQAKFPKAAEIKQQLAEKHFYADYYFNAHIPQSTLNFLNQSRLEKDQPELAAPATLEQMLLILQEALAHYDVLTDINIHGWSATGKIWEIDPSEGKAFVSDQMAAAQRQKKPCVCLNLDVNGWGNTPLTEAGNKILEEGPRALPGYLEFVVPPEQPDVEKPTGQTKSRPKKKTTYLQKREWIKNDPEFRRRMPGSVNHAAEATWLVLNDLFHVGGKRLYWLHSMADRIGNLILTDYDTSPDALGVAFGGGHTERSFREDELSIFYQLLHLLEILPGPMKFIGEKFGITERVKNWTTKYMSSQHLPDNIRNVITKIHLAGSRQVNLLVTQLFDWSEASEERLNPRITREFFAPDDRIIPLARFKEWVNLRPTKAQQKQTATLLSYPNPLLEQQVPDTVGHSHYFFLDPKLQPQLIQKTMESAMAVWEAAPAIDPSLPLIKQAGFPIRFAVLPDDHPILKSTFQDRVNLTLAKRDNLPMTLTPALVPITREEAAYLASQPNLPCPAINKPIREEYLKRAENNDLQQQYNSAEFNAVQRLNIDFLLNNFPFDLYLRGVVVEDRLSSDIQIWVNHQKEIFNPKQLTIVTNLLEQLYHREKARLQAAQSSK